MERTGYIQMAMAPRQEGRRPALHLRVDRMKGSSERAVAFRRTVPDRTFLRLSGVWSVPLSADTLRYILEDCPAGVNIEQVPGLHRDPSFLAAAREIEERRAALRTFLSLLAERKTRDRDGIEEVPGVLDLYPFKRKPLLHQQFLFLFALLFPNVGLTTDVGMGKTQVAIDAFAYRSARGEANTALIIAPSYSLDVGWGDEFSLLSSLAMRPILSTADFEKVARGGFNEYQAYALSWNIAAKCLLTPAGFIRDELVGVFDTLIVDESHRAKAMSRSKRAQAIRKFARQATSLKFRQILTGTFTPKNIMDSYAQIFILDGGATFGADFFHFTNTYFFPVGKVYKKLVPYKGSYDKIKKRLEPLTLSFERRECLDLPEEIVKHYELAPAGEQAARLADLDARAEEIYRRVEEAGGEIEVPEEPQLVTIEEADDIPAGGLMAEIQRIRMQQRKICSGFYDDKDRGRVFLDRNPKLDRLLEILEDIPEDDRVQIWCFFRGEAEILTRAMQSIEADFRAIVGGMATPKKTAILRDFKEHRFRVLIATYGTISESIGLQFVNQIFNFSRDWNFGNMYQADGRTNRIGSEVYEAIYRRELRIKNSVEDDIYANLRTKGNLRTFLMRDRAAMRARRKR
ncbi:MAG: DEAD/DEAH box helicase [Thermotogota bacterium]